MNTEETPEEVKPVETAPEAVEKPTTSSLKMVGAW